MSLEERIHDLSNLSSALGLLTKQSDASFIPLKIALEPYYIKQSHYNEIGQISNIWQKLIYLASKDLQLIKRTFQQVAKVDEMIQKVYQIFLKTCSTPTQDSLILSRVDYFKNTDQEFKIIEYNMTAVSMHSHSQNFLKAHKLIDFKQQRNQQIFYPINTPCTEIAEAVAEMYSLKGLKGTFLMVVSLHERNVIDQANIQLKLLEKGIKTKRQCLCRLYSRIQKKQKKLFIDNEEVSMVYYRAGYQPKDYCENGKISECWEVRQTIELSDAIKIPDVKMELMNQKRMQVELSKPKVYFKYLTQEESRILQKSLVFMADFQQSEQKIDYIKLLQQKGIQKFILKPNLQGGGNNIYGKSVYNQLQTITEEERKKYILMEKIETDSVQNTMIFGKQHKTLKCICEISRYGFLIEIDGKITKNTTQGYLVRIKPQTFDEGGLIAGFGALAIMAFEK